MTPTPAPDDHSIEQANQQGLDDTCGERVIVMAACEDGLLPIDTAVDKANVDALWNRENPGISEFSSGTDLEQERDAIWFMAGKVGKTVQIAPVSNAADLANPAYAHKGIALNLGPILNINSNHFLLLRKADGDDGVFLNVLDSAKSVDWGNDKYAISAVLQGAADIFGFGNQFGWMWNWV